MRDKLTQAMAMAIFAHGNQRWGKHPYYVHLSRTEELLVRFGYADYTTSGGITRCVIAWLHDTLEDTALSYNDIKNEFGGRVAEAVYAVTEEKGRTRQERKPVAHYEAIRANPDACIVKIADRSVNVEESKQSGSRMLEVYRNEHQQFKEKLCAPAMCDSLWAHLDILFL
jgi:guanosine-3',5'-bis(diphosphate) 3'-pyrophosphohydrolase